MAKLTPNARNIESYAHADKERLNNPPVGLVTPDTDKDVAAKSYAYDPHLDPQLVWAGKAEHTSFAVPTVSLHVHERIDPRAIIDAVRQQPEATIPVQPSLFDAPIENLPIRQAIEFYRHKHNWSNRLIAGDSLLVMNSLLEKEGMAGQVQMVFIDPPYGIKYGSNFQPFMDKRNVKDGNDEDLTSEPETIKAFRDTWELGLHSYLSYMRDRVLLAKELLHESGSLFIQIGEENVHKLRCICDEVFGVNNFVSQISVFKTTTPRSLLDNNLYYLLWYAKAIEHVKYRQLYLAKNLKEWTSETKGGSWGVTLGGIDRPLTPQEKADPEILPDGSQVYQLTDMFSAGDAKESVEFKFQNTIYYPRPNTHWKTTQGLTNLANSNRIEVRGERPWFKKYYADYPVRRLTNVWSDTSGKASQRIYVVQTQEK